MDGGEVKGAAGFINPETGQLRSQKELEKADAEIASKKPDSASSDPAVSSDFSKETRAVFKELKADLYREVNSVVSEANEQIDHLRSAKDLHKQIGESAKDLKKLLKEGDSEAIAEGTQLYIRVF